MKAAAFHELLESVRDAGAYLKGKRKTVVRTDRISPQSVAAIRAKLKLSQAQFARAFGISLDTLQNWEQGRRQPTGAGADDEDIGLADDFDLAGRFGDEGGDSWHESSGTRTQCDECFDYMRPDSIVCAPPATATIPFALAQDPGAVEIGSCS